MTRALSLVVFGWTVGMSSIGDAQISPRVQVFNREQYVRETEPESLQVYHWAVWRNCIHPQSVRYVGREAFRLTYGYHRAERYSPHRTVGGVRVTEFKDRAEDSGIAHGELLENINIGPLWVTKRAIDARYVAPYDLIEEGENEVMMSVTHYGWADDDLPPPMDAYWADGSKPDWFNDKRYRLFVPHEETEWWCRTESGQWDRIDKGELVEENGAGVQLNGPNVKFEGNY